MSIFYPDQEILIIATKATVAKNFLEKAKLAYQYTPAWMKPKLKEWNQFSLGFSNSSRIVVSTTTADAGRSFALSLLIIDECSFIESAESIWTSVAPTMSTGGKAILLSTPNGAQGFFYETYISATESEDKKKKGVTEGTINFTPIRLDWWLHPERDQKWYDEQCKSFNYDDRKIGQELLCSFLSSGSKVIPPAVLKWHNQNPNRVLEIDNLSTVYSEILNSGWSEVIEAYGVKGDPTKDEGLRLELLKLFQDSLRLYATHDRLRSKSCFLSCDVATGYGSDFSTIIGLDESGFNFCSFKAQIDTKMHAIIMHLLSRYYRCELFFERNGPGQDIRTRLVTEIGSELVADGFDEKPGFVTTGISRVVYISRMTAALCDLHLQNRPTINDDRILKELDMFVWKNNKPEAQSGYNDDLVMALALCCTVIPRIEYNSNQEPMMLEHSDTVRLRIQQEEEKPYLEVQTLVDTNSPRKSFISDVRDDLPKEEVDRLNLFESLNVPDDPRMRDLIAMWDQFGIPHK
jgi:hypothetical protein